MISVLLIFLLFGVLQVALLFYSRTIVSASAADGARFAANADVADAAGGQRASDLVARGLNRSVAAGVPCVGSQTTDPATGLQLAQVRCRGSIRSVFLPLGALVHIDVTAHALEEQQP